MIHLRFIIINIIIQECITIFIKVKLKIIISHIPSQFSLPPRSHERNTRRHCQYFRVFQSTFLALVRFLNHSVLIFFIALF
uniref:Uncharacterized protein n=1 Tax=virus sp. ctkyY8 TaxID=2827995 RepID=A0A8S5REN7_9VIRU|nr:MAG TPA: hypothetical protein [virus sp. ctkyY8]